MKIWPREYNNKLNGNWIKICLLWHYLICWYPYIPYLIPWKKFSNNNTVGQTVKSGVSLSVSVWAGSIASFSALVTLTTQQLLSRCAIHIRGVHKRNAESHTSLQTYCIEPWILIKSPGDLSLIFRFGKHWECGVMAT